MKMNKKKMIFSIFLITILIVPAVHSAEVLTITGSSTVLPVAAKCAEVFNEKQGDITVQVSGGGSGHGIEAVATGKADIGMASREVKDSEINKYGDKFIEDTIARDGMAVVVSSKIYKKVQNLTKEQIRMIFDGKIKNWKEVGGPDKRIFVVVRKSGSGTRDTFMEAIFGSSKAEARGKYIETSENSEMKTAISQSDIAIGYLGLGYLGGKEVKAISVDGVSPTKETVKDGTYPIARSLYLYTWEKTSLKEGKFIDFILSEEGQKIVEEEGFVPAR